ncbi:PREDICTED: uncharacterized protein LOC106897118 [Calidris pugnax]|uniref:uncharacterized protein LOC106897118 n=1 Tax=Calidris pugnax TaxID=198806 RepID=UPI00071D6FBB|nr:PREDICTED: uncharacterized protein LOC106897118 [Calidris pugnax]
MVQSGQTHYHLPLSPVSQQPPLPQFPYLGYGKQPVCALQPGLPSRTAGGAPACRLSPPAPCCHLFDLAPDTSPLPGRAIHHSFPPLSYSHRSGSGGRLPPPPGCSHLLCCEERTWWPVSTSSLRGGRASSSSSSSWGDTVPVSLRHAALPPAPRSLQQMVERNGAAREAPCDLSQASFPDNGHLSSLSSRVNVIIGELTGRPVEGALATDHIRQPNISMAVGISRAANTH